MWLSNLKDRALAQAAMAFLNRKYKSLGKITALRLDTRLRTVEVSAELAGETLPVEAKIAYRLDEQAGAVSFVPTNVQCSRRWIEVLAAQMIAEGALRVVIPPGLAEMVLKAIA